MLRKLLAFVGLQAADHVPLDGAGQEFGLFEEFLHIVFAEMGLERGGRGLVQGEDVVGGFEFRDGD